MTRDDIRTLGYNYRLEGFNRPQQGLLRDRMLHVARDKEMLQALLEGFAEAQADEERLLLQTSQARGTEDRLEPEVSEKDLSMVDKPIPNDNGNVGAKPGAEEREKTMSNANMFQIQKGLPLPQKRRMSNLGAEPKYPFSDMSPGDSFQGVGERERNNALNALSKYQADHPGWRGASRTIGRVDETGMLEDIFGNIQEIGVEHAGEPVWRIWRVEAKDLKPNGQLR